MRFTGKNESHLQKWVTRHKMGHIEKTDHTCKNWSHLKKMDHIWRNVSHLQNASLFQKWVTLAKIGQTLLHLEKRVTLPETG